MTGNRAIATLASMTTTEQREHTGAFTWLLVRAAALIVFALWVVFLFGNPFAESADGSNGEPVVVEVIDEGPASETLSREELQRLLDEEGASHDGEALIHSEPGS